MRVLLALLLVLGFAACDETILGRTPDPSPTVDMGMDFPALPLQVGESFVYEALLTRRSQPTVENDSAYRIRLTITDVVDGGEDELSEVSYTVEAEERDELADPDWVPQFDADSWVAQLGPSQVTDAVASQPTTLLLEGGPTRPEPPKMIPAASTFFLDLRFPAEIQSDWASMGNAMIDQTSGGLRLSASFIDSSLRFHEENELVMITLEYDERGVLTSMRERIGDSEEEPTSFMRLDCVEGCL
jgi:hypothetical protein